MRRDRTDALAKALFVAAREEQPARALVERVTALGAEGRATSGDAGPGTPRVNRPRRSAARGALAATLCGALAAAFLLLPRTREEVLISRDRSPSGSVVESVPPAAPAARQPSADPLAPPPVAPAAPLPESKTPPLPRATASAPAHPSPRARGDAPPKPSVAPSAAAAAADGAVARSTPAPTFSSELGVLKQVRLALRARDGRAALALLDGYDSGEYGKTLSLEATVLRIEALEAVGQHAEARALARRFVRDNPDSPLAERAQRFVESASRATPSSPEAP